MISYSYSLTGGYLTSLTHNGHPEMHAPEARSWTGTDIAIFPFVARLKGGKYKVAGKEYALKNHGVARYAKFKVLSDDGKKAHLLLSSDEETRKIYPFDFRFEIFYEAGEDTMKVTYKATNVGQDEMPFGLGAHPSFRLPCREEEGETDISGNVLDFGREADLKALDFEETYRFLTGTVTDFGKVIRLPLSKAMFQQRGTYLFLSQDIHEVTLVKKDGSKAILRFHAPYFAVWSHPHFGGYVCLEPWMSLPDYVDAPSEMKEKKSLLSLKPGEEYVFSYEIEYRD